MRSSLLLVLLVVGCGSAASTADGPYDATRSAACLEKHNVLAGPVAQESSPPGFKPKQVATISFGFAFASGNQAVDRGAVVFDRDASTARRRYAALLVWNDASAEAVPGLSLKAAKAEIRSELTRRANAIVSWEHTPQQASRTVVEHCLH